MSKLGSAPPPPPYKVPLSERLFGIGKLKPPVTEGVTASDLLSTVRLGAFSLELDANGAWQMDSKLEQMYRAQITALEAKVAQLEDERLDQSAHEMERRAIVLERERLQLLDENNQLKFKNKVLMAMCTISEGDYKALCKEAGIEPRSQKKPLPSPAAAQPLASPATAAAAAPYQPQPVQFQPPAASPSNTTLQGPPSVQRTVSLALPAETAPYSTTSQPSINRQASAPYQITSAR